jgi:hypothetical protein
MENNQQIDLNQLIDLIQALKLNSEQTQQLISNQSELLKKDLRNLNIQELFTLVESGAITQPVIKRFYLSTAKSNEFYSLAGNYFYIVSSDSTSNWVNVKFNRQDSDPIKFERGFGLRTPFTQFWLTSDAQTDGYIDVLVGQISPNLLEIIDNRTAIITQQTLEDILAELRGNSTAQGFNEVAISNVTATSVVAANTSRKSVIIYAKDTNTGKMYLGFDNTVATNKYFIILNPGQAYAIDDYRGAIFALATVNSEKLSYGEV